MKNEIKRSEHIDEIYVTKHLIERKEDLLKELIFCFITDSIYEIKTKAGDSNFAYIKINDKYFKMTVDSITDESIINNFNKNI